MPLDPATLIPYSRRTSQFWQFETHTPTLRLSFFIAPRTAWDPNLFVVLPEIHVRPILIPTRRDSHTTWHPTGSSEPDSKAPAPGV